MRHGCIIKSGEEARSKMAGSVSIADVLRLSVAERIQLVEDIWDSIAAVPEAVPLTDGQREELDRRLESYHRDPAAGEPWEEVRERIRTGKTSAA